MSKKLAVTAIIAAAALGCLVLAFPDNKGNEGTPQGIMVDASTPARRIGYFAAHGWDVEEISGKEITIPSDFSTQYEEYAALQDKQGLPLREYAGKSGKIYVYEVKNYSPDNRKMLAELLVCDDTAVASLVYSEDNGGLRMSVS